MPQIPRRLTVHLLASAVDGEELAGSTAVVIDVLRATTTIAYALAAGASRIVPCGTTDETRAKAAEFRPGTVILGGERGGSRIEGFDLGNSPTEYTPNRVAGKTVVFTTTNGTRAMIRARAARRILLAAFVNCQAVIRELLRENGSIDLICAGTDGHVTVEDVLLAGVLCEALCASGDFQPDDGARLAVSAARQYATDSEAILSALRSSRGGINLRSLGMDADIETAARRDVFNCVPELHVSQWSIT